MLTVVALMTENPYPLVPDHTSSNVSKSMSDHNIPYITVADDNADLPSTGSRRDLLAAQDSSLASSKQYRRHHEKRLARSTIITTAIQTTAKHAALPATIIHLQRNRLAFLPVLRAKKLGRIIDSDSILIATKLMKRRAGVASTEYEDEELDRELDYAVGNVL